MKYLKRFANNTEYFQFKNSEDYLEPNLSIVDSANSNERIQTSKKEDNILTLTAITGGNLVIKAYGKTSPNISYSINGSNYAEYTFDKDGIGEIITVNQGDCIKLIGNNLRGLSSSIEDYMAISYSGTMRASGDVTSLLNEIGGDYAIPIKYCFYRLFSRCNIVQSPNLPSTSLAENCYFGMFYRCHILKYGPKILPATTLARGCYSGMFQDCVSLTSAPTLPATKLADGCYSSMFLGCEALTHAPALPATTLAQYCYESMFFGCISLTHAPALPATTLADNCYASMFFGCTSLTRTPKIVIESSAKNCCVSMFYNCTKISYCIISGFDKNLSNGDFFDFLGSTAQSGILINLGFCLFDDLTPKGWSFLYIET